MASYIAEGQKQANKGQTRDESFNLKIFFDEICAIMLPTKQFGYPEHKLSVIWRRDTMASYTDRKPNLRILCGSINYCYG
jgi:hypothetical protein